VPYFPLGRTLFRAGVGRSAFPDRMPECLTEPYYTGAEQHLGLAPTTQHFGMLLPHLNIGVFILACAALRRMVGLLSAHFTGSGRHPLLEPAIFKGSRASPVFSWLLGNALGIAATFQGHLRPISEQPPRAISSQMPLFLTLAILATSAT
jgi:hypothetical protein